MKAEVTESRATATSDQCTEQRERKLARISAAELRCRHDAFRTRLESVETEKYGIDI